MNNATDDATVATVNFAAPPRGPVDAVRTCLVKFFDFRGRASRSEFWWFFAAILPVMLLYGEHLIYFLHMINLPVSLWAATYMLVHIAIRFPLWAAAVRRLHDVGRTGWWILPDVADSLALVAATVYMYYFHEGNFPGTGGGPLDEYLALIKPLDWTTAWQRFMLALTVYYLFTEGGRIVALCLCSLKSKSQQNRFDRMPSSAARLISLHCPKRTMQTQTPKKPFYKRPWGFIALVVATPIVAVALLFAYLVGSHYLNYFVDASKLPPEARWLLEHMSERQRIEDMVENAEKYRQLPCAEVQILEHAYCFDRSRMGNMHIYTSRQSGEFRAFQFFFVSEILPTDKTTVGYEHVIKRVTLRRANSDYDVIGENGLALSIPHRMVYNSIVGFREDEAEREKYNIIYRELLQNNNKLVDISPFQRPAFGLVNSDKRVFIEGNIPVALVDLDTDEYVNSRGSSWKYTGQMVRYAPAWQPFYIEFYFRTKRGASRDEVRLRYIRVAKEIWQFLEYSKLH